ncbi:hypothetical protein BDW02DRAFT_167909 [Decorospora gaudefroyi]|uniref:Uncharacterized protein n=1 Tax=Decorospora gaudefroyi TaxID=184978 RepID=A0A6A5K408_9PLEO|nr:hypothetical protein BDW02DRAFT_167909 [Decorospora gaudefroyi]
MAGVVEAGLGSTTSDLVITGLPALTSIFTSKSECADKVILVQYGPAADPYQLIQWVPNECFPSASVPTYSPGICPDGYGMVTITEYHPSSSASDYSRLWKASCCPSGMTMTASYELSYCKGFFENGPITAYRDVFLIMTETISDTSTTEYMIENPDGLTGNMTVLTSATITGEPIVIYWQVSDLSKFDPDYASLLARRLDIEITPTAAASLASETARPSSSPFVPSPTSISPSDPASQRLTTGAKAGIGVGAAVGAVLLSIAAFLLYKRHMRSASETKYHKQTAPQNEQPELVQARIS